MMTKDRLARLEKDLENYPHHSAVDALVEDYKRLQKLIDEFAETGEYGYLHHEAERWAAS